MTVLLSPTRIYKSWRNDGTPNAQGTMNTYLAGTTTPQVTYPDSTQSTPNTNPIVFDARGEANVWLDPSISYKFAEYDSSGTLLGTTDNISVFSAFTSGSFTATLTGCSNNPLPTALFYWAKSANIVTITCPTGVEGTSNVTTATLTGLPAALWVARQQEIPVTDIENNSTTGLLGSVLISPASGTMTLLLAVASGNYTRFTASGFTASGLKAFGPACSFTYSLV
jgi:hypothetical protein